MRKKYWIIGLALLLVFIFAAIYYIIPNAKYNNAQKLMAEHRYEEAQRLFEEIDNFKDAKNMAAGGVHFRHAEHLRQLEQFEEAAEKFAEAAKLGNADAFERSLDAYYSLGEKLLKEGKHEQATQAFAKAKNYKDAETRLSDHFYAQGETLLAQGKPEEALTVFQQAKGYKDVDVRMEETYYALAEKALAAGDYAAATEFFSQAGDFKDAKTRIAEPSYIQAEKALADGRYEDAIHLFGQAGNFRDAIHRIGEVYYTQGKALLEAGDYPNAIHALSNAGSYPDASARTLEAYYKQAKALLESGLYEDAAEAFAHAIPYEDAAVQAKEAHILWLHSLAQEDKASELAASILASGDTEALAKLRALAEELMEQNELEAAAAVLQSAPDEKENKDLLTKIADALLQNNKGAAANAIYESLGTLKKTPQEPNEVYIEQAKKLVSDGKFKEAIDVYESIGDENAKEMVKETAKMAAGSLLANGDYEAAIDGYERIGDADGLRQAQYKYGEFLLAKQDYVKAIALLENLIEYENAYEYLKAARYGLAQQYMDNREYDKATVLFTALGSYLDAEDKLLEIQYIHAKNSLQNKDYAAAITALEALAGYKDAEELKNRAHYERSLELLAQDKLDEALVEMEKSGYDLRAQTELAQASYTAAVKYLEEGNLERAAELLRKTASNENSKAKLREIARKYIEEGEQEKAYSLLSGIESDTEIAALLQQIAQRYASSGELIKSYSIYKENANDPQTKSRLYPTVYRLKAEADRLYELGDIDGQVALLKLLYENGDLKKSELLRAEFIQFIMRADHFSYGKYNGKTLYWHPLKAKKYRLLSIAKEDVTSMPIAKYERHYINEWLRRFSNTFERPQEKKYVSRIFLFKMSSLQEYLNEAEARQKLISYEEAKNEINLEGYWTASKSKYFRGYYVYDIANKEFVGSLEENEHTVRPALELSIYNNWMHFMLNGNYHFYDAQGNELHFNPSVPLD